MSEEKLERKKGKLSLKWQDETRAGGGAGIGSLRPPTYRASQSHFHMVLTTQTRGSGGKLKETLGLDSSHMVGYSDAVLQRTPLWHCSVTCHSPALGVNILLCDEI